MRNQVPHSAIPYIGLYYGANFSKMDALDLCAREDFRTNQEVLIFIFFLNDAASLIIYSTDRTLIFYVTSLCCVSNPI